MDEPLTTGDLIREAAGRGYSVTSRQLERWRNARVLPEGRKRGRGQGGGTHWTYPPTSLARLLAFLEIRRPREPIAATAVRLWLRGHDLPLDRVRRHLASALATPKRIRRTVAQLGMVRFGERFAEDARRKPVSRRKHGVEKFDHAAYDRFVGIGEAIASAFQNPSAPLPPDSVASIATMMNPSSAVLSVVAALEADFNQEIATALPLVAAGDAAAMDASDEELLSGRALFACVADIVAHAQGIPQSDPRRDFLLLMGGNDDEVFGFACMIQASRRARAEGVIDPLERLNLVRGAL